jgi:rfaE bifunctional protein kinase chain/domain
MKSDHISKKRHEEILHAIRNVKIGILGDLCVDIYWHADMRLSSLSRETPHFPLPIVKERFSLGAGGNVAANVAALQPEKVIAIGMKGCDWRGNILTQELKRWGMDDTYVLEDPQRTTFAYCKPMRKGISDVEYEDPRLDFINHHPLCEQTEKKLITALESIKDRVDAIVVSDQFTHGCVTPRVREAVCALSKSRLVVVDSRENIGMFPGAFLKPNEVEGERALGTEAKTLRKDDYARALAEKTGSRVLMTLGTEGSVYSDGHDVQRFAPWAVKGPVDIVGAGDTFLSGFSCALAAGAAVSDAADFGGLCSAVTISKIGITGTASPEEIMNTYDDLLREE